MVKQINPNLTSTEKDVLLNAATEQPWTSPLNNVKSGEFDCKNCGQPLFSSTAKFESGSGWPSFDKAKTDAVSYKSDWSFFGRRTEVVCSNCEAHLGHVFTDGPKETTGKRYCINGVCLTHDKG